MRYLLLIQNICTLHQNRKIEMIKVIIGVTINMVIIFEKSYYMLEYREIKYTKKLFELGLLKTITNQNWI